MLSCYIFRSREVGGRERGCDDEMSKLKIMLIIYCFEGLSCILKPSLHSSLAPFCRVCLNPLSPKSDQYQNSPSDINAL